MANFSFDIESTYDVGEMNNVYEQVQRELQNRYDLKGSATALDWQDDKAGFKITGDQQFQIDAVMDMIRKTAAKRGIDQKTFDTSADVNETILKMTWEIPFKDGLGKDEAKVITKYLREEVPKVKALIQGDAVRVQSAKKDELQSAMQAMRTKEFKFPVTFTNFR